MSASTAHCRDPIHLPLLPLWIYAWCSNQYEAIGNVISHLATGTEPLDSRSAVLMMHQKIDVCDAQPTGFVEAMVCAADGSGDASFRHVTNGAHGF